MNCKIKSKDFPHFVEKSALDLEDEIIMLMIL